MTGNKYEEPFRYWKLVRYKMNENGKWCCMYYCKERDTYIVTFDGAAFQTPSQEKADARFDKWCDLCKPQN